ncbi:MAG: hypothetical protein WCW40_04520 [Bacteroidota bacterium]
MMTSLMVSCKKATELIEKNSIAGLSLTEKLQLRMHTAMCSACTNYQKQSLYIDTLLKRSSIPEMPAAPPADTSDRINTLMTKILNKNNS